MSEILARLSAEGVAVWLDDISRERLVSGGLAELVQNQHLVGVTSNPTIFQKAITGSDRYDEQVHDLAVRRVGVEEALRMITTYDIRWACDVLRPVYDSTQGVDGRVSIEVDPRLARDTEATIAEARQLWWLVDRPNLFIKIPATVEGLPAISQCLAEGISVIDAFFEGLERARKVGRDLSLIGSVASFFVSRVDTEVDKRLEKIGGDAVQLKGKAAIANARLAYELYEHKFASERWQALGAAGARPQRPLWASTSTKDPSMPDTVYVDELIAPGVVNTMPEATIHATADHGRVTGDTVHEYYADAKKAFEDLKNAGISYDDVVRVLEEEGVEKFATSWNDLIDGVKAELERLAPENHA